MWFEPLPEQCPPADALFPDGVFFRLCQSAKPSCQDFWSHRKISPDAHFRTDECIAMSVSVFKTHASAMKIKKLPLHRDKNIVGVILTPQAGLIKQTFSDQNHHSWWRASTFPLLANLTGLEPE